MRKFLIVAIVALFAVLGVETADAQVRVRPFAKPGIMVPKPPRAMRVRPVRPRLMILPPSKAVRAAMRAVPNAKPLGVKLRGDTYVVRLKSGGTITQVGVDSVTGAVTSIQ